MLSVFQMENQNFNWCVLNLKFRISILLPLVSMQKDCRRAALPKYECGKLVNKIVIKNLSINLVGYIAQSIFNNAIVCIKYRFSTFTHISLVFVWIIIFIFYLFSSVLFQLWFIIWYHWIWIISFAGCFSFRRRITWKWTW